MKNEIIYQKLTEIERLIHLSNNELLDVATAAEFLKTTKGGIYNLVHTKKIPHYKPAGKKLYFMKLDLLDWVKSRRILTDEEMKNLADIWQHKRASWLRP